MKKNIYLAGSCGSESRTTMVSIARKLRRAGYSVHCPFDLKIPNAWDMTQEEWAEQVFNSDIQAIRNCDVMVSISVGRVSTAGTNWEQGYAYGIGKPCHVFQITDAQTSLMTYWGCQSFTNTTLDNVAKDIVKVLRDGGEQLVCKTILT